MISEYRLQGMTCSSCVALIKTCLQALPQIQQAEPDLSTQRITITHASALSLETLQNTLAVYPKYSIKNLDTNVPEPKFLLKYKPVLLIFLMLILCCSVGVWQNVSHHNSTAYVVHEAMREFMGGFFISFSFFKLMDVKGFAARYKMYDPLAKYIPFWALCYPFFECALGLLYLSPFDNTALHGLTVILMLSGSVGVLHAMRAPQQIQCACLGAGFNLPLGKITLLENGIMLLMAIMMMI